MHALFETSIQAYRCRTVCQVLVPCYFVDGKIMYNDRVEFDVPQYSKPTVQLMVRT